VLDKKRQLANEYSLCSCSKPFNEQKDRKPRATLHAAALNKEFGDIE